MELIREYEVSHPGRPFRNAMQCQMDSATEPTTAVRERGPGPRGVAAIWGGRVRIEVPAFLEPGAGFMEDDFPADQGWGMVSG